MKILLCHNYYAGRGGESNVFNNDKNLLEKNGHEVITYTRDNSEILKYSLIRKIY